jgi:hypothetical protein
VRRHQCYKSDFTIASTLSVHQTPDFVDLGAKGGEAPLNMAMIQGEFAGSYGV